MITYKFRYPPTDAQRALVDVNGPSIIPLLGIPYTVMDHKAGVVEHTEAETWTATSLESLMHEIRAAQFKHRITMGNIQINLHPSVLDDIFWAQYIGHTPPSDVREHDLHGTVVGFFAHMPLVEVFENAAPYVLSPRWTCLVGVTENEYRRRLASESSIPRR